MNGIGSYLDKYKHIKPPESSKRKVLVEVVRAECGVLLKESEVMITRGGVRLSCHPTVRSEIARHAPVILDVLHKRHGVHIAFIQ